MGVKMLVCATAFLLTMFVLTDVEGLRLRGRTNRRLYRAKRQAGHPVAADEMVINLDSGSQPASSGGHSGSSSGPGGYSGSSSGSSSYSGSSSRSSSYSGGSIGSGGYSGSGGGYVSSRNRGSGSGGYSGGSNGYSSYSVGSSGSGSYGGGSRRGHYASPSYSSYSSQRTSQGYRHSGHGGSCPPPGSVEVNINGMSCQAALRHYGTGLCYEHAYSSRQCCLLCHARRLNNSPGCEYGDHSSACSSLRAGACYNFENRRTCCATCARFRRANATPGCEYGDLSNRCDIVRSNPGLCYRQENRRMCCQTCERLRNANAPNCLWGDEDSHACRPFETNSTNVRINCYSANVRRACCYSCDRLKNWVPNNLPTSCQYGDHPVTFIVNQQGSLTCSTYFQHFPSSHCADASSDVARYCCYTCFRYQNRG